MFIVIMIVIVVVRLWLLRVVLCLICLLWCWVCFLLSFLLCPLKDHVVNSSMYLIASCTKTKHCTDTPPREGRDRSYSMGAGIRNPWVSQGSLVALRFLGLSPHNLFAVSLSTLKGSLSYSHRLSPWYLRRTPLPSPWWSDSTML